MKKLFFLLISIVCVFASHGQLTATDIGIPESVYQATKNVVFTQQYEQCSGRAPGYGGIEMVKRTEKKVANGVTTTTTEVVITESKYYKPGIRENVGVYGLNLLHNQIFAFGKTSLSQNDSGFVVTNNYSGTKFVMWKKGSTWFAKHENPDYGFQLYNPVTGERRYFSESELISKYKYVKRGTNNKVAITHDMLAKWSENYRIGTERNPTTHVCNVFAIVREVEPFTFVGQAYINGILSDNIQEEKLITSFGKTGMSFTPRWRYMNECVPGNGTTMGNEYGNAGTCLKTQGTMGAFQTIKLQASDVFDPTTTPISFDASKKMWLWFEIESFQAQGKNESDEGYFDVINHKPIQSLLQSSN